MLSQNLYYKTQDVGKVYGLLIKDNILKYSASGYYNKLNTMARMFNAALSRNTG